MAPEADGLSREVLASETVDGEGRAAARRMSSNWARREGSRVNRLRECESRVCGRSGGSGEGIEVRLSRV